MLYLLNKDLYIVKSNIIEQIPHTLDITNVYVSSILLQDYINKYGNKYNIGVNIYEQYPLVYPPYLVNGTIIDNTEIIEEDNKEDVSKEDENNKGDGQQQIPNNPNKDEDNKDIIEQNKCTCGCQNNKEDNKEQNKDIIQPIAPIQKLIYVDMCKNEYPRIKWMFTHNKELNEYTCGNIKYIKYYSEPTKELNITKIIKVDMRNNCNRDFMQGNNEVVAGNTLYIADYTYCNRWR